MAISRTIHNQKSQWERNVSLYELPADENL